MRTHHEHRGRAALRPRAQRQRSVQFSRSAVSDSLRPHGLQHARPPCPSPTPGAYSNPCPQTCGAQNWKVVNGAAERMKWARGYYSKKGIYTFRSPRTAGKEKPKRKKKKERKALEREQGRARHVGCLHERGGSLWGKLRGPDTQDHRGRTGEGQKNTCWYFHKRSPK